MTQAGTGACIVWSSVADPAHAERIAEALVTEGLAACVSTLPGHAVYRWRGALERESQTVLMIKCTARAFPSVRDRLCALHPDEVPELLCTPVSAGLDAYLRWLDDPEEHDA